MKTVVEIRHSRLMILLNKYGTLAKLNEALGLTRTDSTLSQIKNKSTTSRGNPKMMGAPMARRIEAALNLGNGWMDTPPSLAELYGHEDPRNKVWELIVAMPESELATAYRLLNALAQPEPKASNGK